MRVEIEHMRALPDPQRAYKWNMIISKFPGGFGSAERMNIQITSTAIPTQQNEIIPFPSHGHKVNYHGRADYGMSMDVTTYETQDLYIQQFLRRWEEKHWQTQTGVQNVKKDIETEVILELLDAKLEKISTYKLIGCFITNLGNYNLIAENGGVAITFTLSWDYFIGLDG